MPQGFIQGRLDGQDRGREFGVLRQDRGRRAPRRQSRVVCAWVRDTKAWERFEEPERSAVEAIATNTPRPGHSVLGKGPSRRRGRPGRRSRSGSRTGPRSGRRRFSGSGREAGGHQLAPDTSLRPLGERRRDGGVPPSDRGDTHSYVKYSTLRPAGRRSPVVAPPRTRVFRRRMSHIDGGGSGRGFMPK